MTTGGRWPWLWAALALVVLGALYHQSTQVDSDAHVRLVAHFEQLRQQDARLGQHVLQARYGLLRNYDPLVTTQIEISSLLDALLEDDPADFADVNSDTGRAYQRLKSLYAEKFALVEAFKSHASVLRNSVAYLPLATHQTLQQPGLSEPAKEAMHDLLESVLTLSREVGADQTAHVRAVMGAVQALVPPGLAADWVALARHVDLILAYQPEVNGYTRAITLSATDAESRALFDAYAERYKQRQAVADRYRLALTMLAAALLAYVAYTLVALQRARRTLTDSLRELEFQKYALDQHSIVSVADRSGRIIDTNDKLSQISQYSRAELLGQDHRILNSGHHPHDFFKTMWSTIGRGQVWRGLVCNRRKDGGLYWVDSTIVPFMDEAGKVLRYVSIRTDVTDKVAADAQLTAQRAFYEQVTETLGEGLYVQDAQGRCVYLNAEAERLLGWPRADLLGQPVHSAIHYQRPDGSALAESECPITTAFTTDGAATLEDQVFMRRDGTPFPVAVSCRAVRGANGMLESVVVAFADITERKQTELAMRLAKETAERSARVKADFLANMSHEIRTPMNGVIGMTSLVLETPLNAEQREYLGLVKSSADALLTIINDILDFSKIESGKLHVEQVPFDLEALMRETVRTLAMRAGDKGLELLLHIVPGTPAAVLGDPVRLRQVLTNLLGNAIKFTERGEVEVSVTPVVGARAGHARLRFAVRDTGIGVPADKFDTIFDSFSQADTSTTRRYGGTGLGLTISAQLVGLMGGRIGLDSRVGRGSTFHFVLDLALTEQLATQPVPPLALRGLRVLVVDDNATNRLVLVEQLRAWKMQPVAEADAQAGLDEYQRAQAQGQPYALAIVDLQMPGMDGFSLAQALRAADGGMPATVMMLSSAGQSGEATRCRELGVAAYLTKPAPPSELLDAIMTALGQRVIPDALALSSGPSTLRAQRPLSLLLAEDNPVNQRLALVQLERHGHSVVVAVNGVQALERWQTQRFDAVLMDVDMPELNGLEATARIRALEAQGGRARTPIIAMTAHAMAGAREHCLAHGMDGYVSKPIDFDALWDELSALLPKSINATEVVAVDAGQSSAGAGFNPKPEATGADASVLAPPALAVADLSQLRRNVDNDVSLFNELRALLQADAPVRLAQLQTALAGGDAASVAAHAHAIKGMVGVFGATQAMAAAQAVEREPTGPELGARVQTLTSCLDALLAELDAVTW